MNVDNDLDQHLLRQFSCLSTTDKDDLVKQLQNVVACSQLNEATARFFLDMNNWNLQAAICSYFDFESPGVKLPCMTLICDSTIGNGESVPPDTKFRKSWRVQNSGTEVWPDGIFLQHTGGIIMGCTRVPVPPLGPKETIELGIDLVSPPVPDVTYQSKWRMKTSTGSYFGGTPRPKSALL
ncbi:protein ILRUN isoform X2 [Nomia melanderi]|uniref:protein ILRUN isoform X2 n=1 Tax=Nomia melanderi TaxID=2448451 RepID=UPI003FCC74EA